MRIGFAGARQLGIRCLELLPKDQVVAVSVTPSSEDVWWDQDDEAMANRMGYENQTVRDVINATPDLVFSVLASHIFKPDEIDNVPLGIPNLHPAPLPCYRGCAGVAWAITNGDRSFGASLHYVTPGIDDGPIIADRRFPLYPNDTGKTVYETAQSVAFTMFRNELQRFLKGATLPSRPQDESKARYYTRDSIEQIREMNTPEAIRALTFDPFPAHPLDKSSLSLP